MGMHRICTALAAGLLSSAAVAAAQPADAPAGTDHLRLRLVKIMDQQAFGRPIEAASILLPADWNVEAGVTWTQDLGCPRNSIQLSLKAQSPDGRLGFEVLPNYFWTWSDDPQIRQAALQAMANSGIKGCDYLPPYDAADYLQQVLLPRWRAGSTLVGVGRVAELAQALQLEFNAQAPAAAGPAQNAFDVALAALETQSPRGTDEEWVLASLMRTTTWLPALSSLYTGLNQMAGNHASFTLHQFVARAPKGELEKHEGLFDVIYRSFRLHPVWEAAVVRHLMIMDQIERKGVRDRARIMRESQQEISAMVEQGHLARQNIRDRSAERRIQALRGLESYTDPATESRVELSSGFQGAWTNGLGDYVLSTSPSFNPAGLEGTWHALTPEGR